jgi:murein DD-endopeptidase MepM/ murein hydrolase activator NlpD
MNSLFITFILLAISCASAKIPIQKSMEIRPGEVRWVEIELPSKDVNLYCRDKYIRSHKEGTLIRALIIESYFSDLSPFTCAFKQGEQVLAQINFSVVEKKYQAEKLKVDPKRIKLSPKDQARAQAEQLILNKIYASSGDKILFSKSFQGPLQSLVTSYYGTRRVYNKEKKGQHLGIDYRATVGVPVPSTNSGRIAYAGDLFYTGLTVIIDHGLDIFSVYGHLSELKVKDGELVERGQVIGLSGNTGRTSGPHLHWGVKIQSEYVDGFVLIDETKRIFRE